MNHLWSPWRSTYIQSFSESKQSGDCFLCDASQSHAQDSLLIGESPHSIIIMNRYPYNAGHVLLSPKRHCADLLMLSDEEYLDLMHLTRSMQAVLVATYAPHGFNIGMNLGEAGGAGVPGHLHVHIVPRWNGDTNFMSTVADAKVISSSMETIVTELKANFLKIMQSTEPDRGTAL
ncbi:MAG: HIT domain-containing protein [Ignavibacteria bacterium]|nr:HIT domain-containing protein [Ignavibacteria bacterium]